MVPVLPPVGACSTFAAPARRRRRRVGGLAAAVLLLAAGGEALQAGTITGTVHADGVQTTGGGAGGAYASRRYKFVEKVDYDRLTDFVVYIDQTVPGAPAAPRDPVAVVTQQDAMFDPHVLPVVVGTTVNWPNRDDIYHNVFSMSEAAGPDGFDLGLYKGDDATKSVTFARTGRIDVFCSIHANMHCIVLALPSPYFAKVDSGGRYEIRDVPAGTYRLRAWHERVPARAQTVVVPAEGTVEVNFTLGFGELTAP